MPYGVKIAAQVAGEGGQRCQGAVLGVGDPGIEAVTVAAGHHRGERPDVGGELFKVAVAVTDAPELGGVALVEVVGVGHDPAGDLAHRWWFRAWMRRVAAAAAEAVQVALDGQLAAGIAELRISRNSAVALRSPSCQRRCRCPVQASTRWARCSVLAIRSSTLRAVANLRTVAWCSPSLRPIAALDSPWADSR